MSPSTQAAALSRPAAPLFPEKGFAAPKVVRVEGGHSIRRKEAPLSLLFLPSYPPRRHRLWKARRGGAGKTEEEEEAVTRTLAKHAK